jgi:hypothetical protein
MSLTLAAVSTQASGSPFASVIRWCLEPSRPPFCLVVDWVVAAILVVLIAAGVDFHH